MLPGPGWTVAKTAYDREVTLTSIYNGVKQVCFDRGDIPPVEAESKGS